MASGQPTAGLGDVLGAFASGVTLVTVADGRDDIGTTVSAFCPVSLDPPLVLVSLMAGSYPAELLGRIDGFAVTVLAGGPPVRAGRVGGWRPASGCWPAGSRCPGVPEPG